MFHKWASWKISYYHNVKHRKLQLIKVKESVFIICFGMYGHKKIPKTVSSWKLHMSESSFSIKYLCYYRMMTDTTLNITCQVLNLKGLVLQYA